MTPDGIFVDMWGATPGARHNAWLLDQSALMSRLTTHMNTADGEPYCLYGDPAYGMATHLASPFQPATAGP